VLAGLYLYNEIQPRNKKKNLNKYGRRERKEETFVLGVRVGRRRARNKIEFFSIATRRLQRGTFKSSIRNNENKLPPPKMIAPRRLQRKLSQTLEFVKFRVKFSLSAAKLFVPNPTFCPTCGRNSFILPSHCSGNNAAGWSG